jgi:hypothetical protein
MPSRHEFYELVAAEWRDRGIPLMPPAPTDDIVRLFEELRYPLSADVKSLYEVTGGFAHHADDRLWSLWTLAEIRAECHRHQPPIVIFADWLCDSHVYCLQYETPEISSVYISYDKLSLEGDPISGSLAEFLEQLLCNPDEVEAFPLSDCLT